MFFKECRDALLVQLAMPLNLCDLSKSYAELAASFREARPKRPRQLTKLRRSLIY
jgi:cytochrome c biogenesis protein ResB